MATRPKAARHPRGYTAKRIMQFAMNKRKLFKNGNFEAILDCEYWHNRWLECALKYLPDTLVNEKNIRFLFKSTATRDACRVAREDCQTREIILISERVLPSQKVKEEMDPRARYFIYVVLHEIAHAIAAHKSPLLDNLTAAELEAQEKEADELAMKWFNDHVAQRNNKHLLSITKEEIKEAQEKNQILMMKLRDDI